MARYDVEDRLNHWATWIYLFKKNLVGYPKESSIAKFATEGFVPNDNKARTSSLPYDYPEAEEVNALYNRLKLESREKAKAIYVYYIMRVNVRKYAEKKKICRSTFYKQLRAARQWMENHIT